jgi:hypothetical protein
MKSPLSGVCLVLGLLSACVLGCSSDKNGLEKRVSTVQEELVALQNANDRLSERLMAIEMQRMQSPAAAQAESAAPVTSVIERPPLKVVRMGPGASPAEPTEGTEGARESADDTGPRPVIRDIGSGRRSRARAGVSRVRQNEPRAEPSSGEL